MKGIHKYGTRATRILLKRAIWSLTSVHSEAATNSMALFTSRRSGGTWVSEMISSVKEIRELGQPLSIRQIADSGEDIGIPVFEYGQLVGLDEEEKTAIEAYINRLLTGAAIVNAPWRFWETSFSWQAQRLVLKITDTNSLIGWFSDTFDLPVVYLVRHPIPQALSCIKLGWGLTTKAYLRKRQFVETYLTTDQEALAWDIVESGSELEKFVLNWVLENLVPLRKATASTTWTRISYEEAVAHPSRIIEVLVRVFDLSHREKMQAAVHQPSRTTRQGANGVANSDTEDMDRSHLIERWKDEIDVEEQKSLMSILEHFDIHYYEYGSVMPTTEAVS